MDTLALLVSLLLCLAMVDGRTLDEKHVRDLVTEIESEGIKKHGIENRHRRRRWQSNYGYDYRQPVPGYYYPERRDGDRSQDYLPRIIKLLEEISDYVKRPQLTPPPPPVSQPIYIPYPVPYYVPQYLPCPSTNNKNPNITSRFPEMDDVNQNWGFVKNDIDDMPETDGVRPISFKPVKPLQPPSRPILPVEHGSQQAESQLTTKAPVFAPESQAIEPEDSVSVMCKAAVLSCCADDKQKQRQCFDNFGCSDIYKEGEACDSDSVNEALEAFKAAYSPMR